MTETVDITPEPLSKEGFQTLEPDDLWDLKASASTDTVAEGSVSTAPKAAPEVQAGASADALGGGAAGRLTDGRAEPRREALSLKAVDTPGRNAGKRQPGPVRTAIRAVGGGVLVLAIAAGGWLYARPRHPRPSDVQTQSVVEVSVVGAEKPSTDPGVALGVEKDHLTWESKLREIDALRKTLLAKKAEILVLQQNYQYGILELEEEAARLIRRGGIDSLPLALKNRELELALQSIQRRCSYRDNLEKPLRWIDLGSEELLYLQRRAFIDLQLEEIAEGIDMASHMADIDAALSKYQPTAEKLSLSPSVAPPPAPEILWKRLAEQARHMGISADDPQNQEIIAEVCSGDLARLSELSSLGLKGARCLAESGAMQFFLNRLTDLPLAPARKLCEWPGQWLCLNGLTRLSPELAGELFAWPGEWMSLNGLSELPVAAAACLAGWKGRQLELMGLRKTAGIEYLAKWEASGGRLFVPETIRQQIESSRRAGQPQVPARNSGRP